MNKFLRINLQKFGSGVFPVHNNVFKINIKGRTGISGDLTTIKDLETFSIGVDGNTEEWTPMDQEGWIRRAVTGKGLTISLSGKRNYGDPGNDYIAETCMLGTGQTVESEFEWTFPSGSKLTGNCVVNVTQPAGGDTTNIDGIEFEILSDGKPTFTAGGDLADLTFVCTDGTTAATTQIEAVVPALTGGNSYVYKINGTLPVLDENIAGKGWAPYALSDDISTVVGNNIVLLEITAANLAKKGGSAPAVIV